MENDTKNDDTLRMKLQPHELVEMAALAEKAPDYCPLCLDQASLPAKDEFGQWTWECKGGCNP